MTEPVLSVTVTNYDYGRYLPQNIESILSQTFADFELIVIDNASSDESLDVINGYATADPRIRVVAHARNEGMFASIRQSCELCRGRYRVPIEADDWVLAPDAFEVQVDLLERHPSVAFVYSSLTMVSDDRVVSVSHPHHDDAVLRAEDAIEAILRFNLTHTGMMMRLDSLRATRGYPEYPHIADMALAVRLCEVGDVGYVDRSLYAFRLHGSNLHTRPALDVARREIVPVVESAWKGPIGARVPKRVQRRSLRRALVHLPTRYIFLGRRREGWRLYWESVKVRPAATILQPRTLSLLSRTLLGASGHDRLRMLTARLGARRGS